MADMIEVMLLLEDLKDDVWWIKELVGEAHRAFRFAEHGEAVLVLIDQILSGNVTKEQFSHAYEVLQIYA